MMLYDLVSGSQQFKGILGNIHPTTQYQIPEPHINPIPHPYLTVMWIHTLLYPGSHGRR